MIPWSCGDRMPLEESSVFRGNRRVSSGDQAIEFARQPSTLVLLDMQVRGLDGACRCFPRAWSPAARSTSAPFGRVPRGSELALQALVIGASDVVAKPSAGHFSDQFVQHLLDRLIHLDARGRADRAPERVDQASARLQPAGRPVRAVGIGGSTGGISAIVGCLRGWTPACLSRSSSPASAGQFPGAVRRAIAPYLVPAVRSRGWLAGPCRHHPCRPGTAYLSLRRDHAAMSSSGLTRRSAACTAIPGRRPDVQGMAPSTAGACGVVLSGIGRDERRRRGRSSRAALDDRTGP